MAWLLAFESSAFMVTRYFMRHSVIFTVTLI